jgi:hypothetical protein
LFSMPKKMPYLWIIVHWVPIVVIWLFHLVYFWFLFCRTRVWKQGPHLESLHQLFFVKDCFSR